MTPNMHIEIFVHQDQRGTRASVHAWWASGKGLHHAWLMDSDPIETPAELTNPWGLLRSLYEELAARRARTASVVPVVTPE